MDHPIFGKVISTYSRKQALEDGVLVDVSSTAKEAGFKYPVAVTSELWHEFITPKENDAKRDQSASGRLWDVLNMLKFAIRANKDQNTIYFKVIFIFGRRKPLVELKAVVSGGDNGEPVITIMMANED